MHDIIFGSFEDKLLQKCLFHAGWMLREAQSSEQMVKSMQGTNKEAAWSEQNFCSWFEDPPSESLIPDNLNQAYEIMNSSSVSHIVWTDDEIFIFTLIVIDPEFRREDFSGENCQFF
ncbi:PREDICTED: uncharacterized protein C1orf101-like [Acropora digitifera]|uniref:uncharacterized protein C1orf101-like n=1 Tax=Acropora digitifera TaxID=70779 RepID=UPI00077AB9AA|nr:PREDICTED: uncharacterized protein C1orf101-like [Acropora digitifera]